jgi:hypothetical protein
MKKQKKFRIEGEKKILISAWTWAKNEKEAMRKFNTGDFNTEFQQDEFVVHKFDDETIEEVN